MLQDPFPDLESFAAERRSNFPRHQLNHIMLDGGWELMSDYSVRKGASA